MEVKLKTHHRSLLSVCVKCTGKKNQKWQRPDTGGDSPYWKVFTMDKNTALFVNNCLCYYTLTLLVKSPIRLNSLHMHSVRSVIWDSKLEATFWSMLPDKMRMSYSNAKGLIQENMPFIKWLKNMLMPHWSKVKHVLRHCWTKSVRIVLSWFQMGFSFLCISGTKSLMSFDWVHDAVNNTK